MPLLALNLSLALILLLALLRLVARQSSPLFSSPRAARRFAASPFLTVVAAAACVLVASDAFGCPNCKDAVNTSDPEGLNLARGYFYSILIMLAMPFTLLSSFGIYVWREVQRQKRAGLLPAEQSVTGSPMTGPYERPSSEPVALPHP
jgi:hypothetical protein